MCRRCEGTAKRPERKRRNPVRSIGVSFRRCQEIDITKNESGTSIAEEAGVKLEETLEREQNKLQENSADLFAKVLEMQDGVGEIIESLDVSVEKGNIKSEEEVETILGEYEEKIISNIQGLDFKEDPATGGYILEFATKKDLKCLIKLQNHFQILSLFGLAMVS